MPYCMNCGQKIPEGAKFCHECGASIVNSKESNNSQRKKEFVGSIRKCPSCGESINSFTAICPVCGHELNDTQISETLEKFIAQVNDCESMIARSKEIESGWASWSKTKKVWWIILNICFAALPVAIYLTYKFLTIDSKPKLSQEEAKLVSLIENFPFPNDRESILDALFFIKEKIAYISQEKASRKSLYWLRLWTSKAEQLKQKADLLFPNDVAVRQSFSDINEDSSNVNKNIRIKKIIIVILWIVFLVFGYMNGDSEDSTDNDKNINDTNVDYTVMYEWPSEGLSSYLPQPNSEYGKIKTDDESRFSIVLYQVNKEQFDGYVKMCKDKGFTINTTKTDQVFYAYNSDEFSLDIFYHEDKAEMEIFIDVPMKMNDINWSSNKATKQLPTPKSLVGNIWSNKSDEFGVYIDSTNQDDFNQYIDECIKKGFDVDFVREDDYFNACNKDGYELTLRLQEFDVMQIYIKVVSDK